MPDLSWLISTYFLPVRNVDSYAHVVTSDNKSTDIRTEQTRLSTDANFSRMNEIVNCSKLLMTEPDCELHQTSHDWTRLWTAPNFSVMTEHNDTSGTQDTTSTWDGTHYLCKITSLGNVQVPLWQHHGRKCPLTDRGHRHRWANQRCLMNELHSRWAMKWPIRNSQ